MPGWQAGLKRRAMVQVAVLKEEEEGVVRH